MKYAAGVLPYCKSTGRFLISKRGPNISNPNVWTNFGGGSERGETPLSTAVREFREESGYKSSVRLLKSYPTKNSNDGIVFYNYIGIVDTEFKPTTIGKKTVDGNVEVSKCQWLDLNSLYKLPKEILHPGFYTYLKIAEPQLKKFKIQEMNSSLKNILDRLDENYNFHEELTEEELWEDNVTGAGEVVDTPYAFSKKVRDPNDISYSEPVYETDRFYKKIEDNYNRLNQKIKSLTEASYKDYKGDSTRTSTQKINLNIHEINKKLREVEQMINHASKLKLETGSDQTVFWKGTLGNFLKIKERLNRLSNKITEFNS